VTMFGRVPPSLARHMGFLMVRIGTTSRERFQRELGPLGLHPKHYGALRVLRELGPVTQQELGRATQVDPSSVVMMIDELEERGLVERRRHPSDRRAHALHVTPAGEEAHDRCREIAQRVEDELFGELDGDEREQLRALLIKVIGGTAEPGVPAEAKPDVPGTAEPVVPAAGDPAEPAAADPGAPADADPAAPAPAA
jgi:DNA-binding MarR family transcriptional regulator